MKTLVLFGCLCLLQATSSDTESAFRMKDGSIVRGAIVEATGTTLRIRSRSLGEMTLARSEVTAIDGREDFALRSAEKQDEERIDSEGTVWSKLTWIDRNTGQRPLSTYRFLAEGSLVKVTDPLGLPLDVSKETADGLTRCTVSLPIPVPVGEPFTLVLETVRKKAVPKRDGAFVYDTVIAPDQALTYRRVLTLPAGAVVVSVSPEPAEQVDGRLVWKGTLSPGQRFEPKVVYRLS